MIELKEITPSDFTISCLIKPHLFSKKKEFHLDDQIIRMGDNELRWSEIRAYRYGSIQHSTYGVNTQREYEISFKAEDERELKVKFTNGSLKMNQEKSKAFYDMLLDAVWYAWAGKLAQGLLKSIQAGKTVEVAECSLNSEGIEITNRKMLVKKERL